MPWYKPGMRTPFVHGGTDADAGQGLLRLVRGDCSAGNLVEIHVYVHLVPSTAHDSGMGAEPVSKIGAPSGPVVARIQAADLTITQALDAWARDMRRRNRRESSIDRMGSIVRGAAAEVGWGRAVDVTLETAGDWLAAKREGGWAPGTHDTALAALKAFSTFLHKSKRLPDDPLAMLARCGDEPGGGARAATTEELRGIIRAAIRAQLASKRARGNRALFWAFLAYTGMRMDAEAARVRWRDLHLDAEHPHILTAPERSKNRRTMRIVLHPQLVTLLRRHRLTVPHGPEDPVFPIVPNRHSWAQDREAAGSRYEDERGRQLSAHSCRKWLASTLDANGASPGVVSRVLRHAGSLAEARYIDPDIRAEVLAVSALPNLFPENDGNPLELGTETDDTPPVAAHEDSTHQLDSEPGALSAAGLRQHSVVGGPPAPESVVLDVPDDGIEHGLNGPDNAHSRTESSRAEMARLIEAQAQTLLIVARLLRGAADDARTRAG